MHRFFEDYGCINTFPLFFLQLLTGCTSIHPSASRLERSKRWRKRSIWLGLVSPRKERNGNPLDKHKPSQIIALNQAPTFCTRSVSKLHCVPTCGSLSLLKMALTFRKLPWFSEGGATFGSFLRILGAMFPGEAGSKKETAKAARFLCFWKSPGDHGTL